MWLPVDERAPEEFQIQASNWKEALLLRFKEEPEHRFEARIREIKRDWIWYSITYEFWMLYVDMYKLDTEEILWNKLFNSVEELTNYLKEGY